jgi:hypothetical protein
MHCRYELSFKTYLAIGRNSGKAVKQYMQHPIEPPFHLTLLRECLILIFRQRNLQVYQEILLPSNSSKNLHTSLKGNLVPGQENVLN